jgi:hypothetical protein
VYEDFVVARNPEEDSTLPYLLRIPLGARGVVDDRRIVASRRCSLTVRVSRRGRVALAVQRATGL